MWRLGVIKSFPSPGVQRDVSLWVSAVRCGNFSWVKGLRGARKQAALSVRGVSYFVPHFSKPHG